MERTLETVQQTAGSAQLRQVEPVLVLDWCAHEPQRAGELIPLRATRGTTLVLGRGDPGSGVEAADLVHRRPGGDAPQPALRDPHLSREQLHIRLVDGPVAGVEVENIGRCPMTFRGEVVRRAVLQEGMSISLGSQVLLRCQSYPQRLPALVQKSPRPHRFGQPDRDGWVGEGAASWLLREQVSLVARRDRHVLLVGESGTGKELLAQAVHARSPRGRRVLVSRNAATFPESLIDAEVFGNARNYPNPGMPERKGLVGEADGSTLFLDEIGELPAHLQAHLLRVLDDGEYQRLGEGKSRKADLRLVAATNRPTEHLKHDFLARFTLRLEVPSLRARREDIAPLILHLLRKVAREDTDLRDRFFDEERPRISTDLVAALVGHDYSTNVRELEHLLWKALLTSPGKTIRLTGSVWAELSEVQAEDSVAPADVSAEELLECLRRNDGVQARVWRELGLANRYVLRRLLKKYESDGWDFSD